MLKKVQIIIVVTILILISMALITTWLLLNHQSNMFLESVEKRSELYSILKEIIDNGVILTHSRLEKEYVTNNKNND